MTIGIGPLVRSDEIRLGKPTVSIDSPSAAFRAPPQGGLQGHPRSPTRKEEADDSVRRRPGGLDSGAVYIVGFGMCKSQFFSCLTIPTANSYRCQLTTVSL